MSRAQCSVMVGVHVLQSMATSALVHLRVKMPDLGAVSEQSPSGSPKSALRSSGTSSAGKKEEGELHAPLAFQAPRHHRKNFQTHSRANTQATRVCGKEEER